MVNRQKKTLENLIKDLAGMGIKVVCDEAFNLLKATGVAVKRGKQGMCVINRTGGNKFPNLYFGKYGVNITQMGKSHYIVPVFK